MSLYISTTDGLIPYNNSNWSFVIYQVDIEYDAGIYKTFIFMNESARTQHIKQLQEQYPSGNIPFYFKTLKHNKETDEFEITESKYHESIG